MFKNSQAFLKNPLIKWMSVELEQMRRNAYSLNIAVCQGNDNNRKPLGKY